MSLFRKKLNSALVREDIHFLPFSLNGFEDNCQCTNMLSTNAYPTILVLRKADLHSVQFLVSSSNESCCYACEPYVEIFRTTVFVLFSYNPMQFQYCI